MITLIIITIIINYILIIINVIIIIINVIIIKNNIVIVDIVDGIVECRFVVLVIGIS